MHWDYKSRLASSPFESIFNFIDDNDDDIGSKPVADNAASLMQSSDWYPEAMMAFMCAEPKGPIVAIKNYIKGIVTWLSQWMDCI